MIEAEGQWARLAAEVLPCPGAARGATEVASSGRDHNLVRSGLHCLASFLISGTGEKDEGLLLHPLMRTVFLPATFLTPLSPFPSSLLFLLPNRIPNGGESGKQCSSPDKETCSKWHFFACLSICICMIFSIDNTFIGKLCSFGTCQEKLLRPCPPKSLFTCPLSPNCPAVIVVVYRVEGR